jgi:hypothetical protein
MQRLLLLVALSLSVLSCSKNTENNYDTSNLVDKKWDLLLREKHLANGMVLWDSVYTPEKENQSSYYIYHSDGTYCLRRWPYYDVYDTGSWHCSGNQLLFNSNIPNMTVVPATILSITQDTFRFTYLLDNNSQTNIETRVVIP